MFPRKRYNCVISEFRRTSNRSSRVLRSKERETAGEKRNPLKDREIVLLFILKSFRWPPPFCFADIARRNSKAGPQKDITTLRFPSKCKETEEKTAIANATDSRNRARNREDRAGRRTDRQIQWLEIVQADYTFSFVLKYGGSQRENNVSLITRFGSTRATPVRRSPLPCPVFHPLSMSLRFAPISIFVWLKRVDATVALFTTSPSSLPTPCYLHRNGD